VRDSEDPTISCPNNIAVDNEAGVCKATVEYDEPLASDNCPSATMQRTGQASETEFNVGAAQIDYTVTDGAARQGNTSLCCACEIVCVCVGKFDHSIL
jgi:hypothetical protein